MLPATEEEMGEIADYYRSQSPKAEVTFLQKVYSETVIGHRHDVWDLHATDGRWWVITNPTNLCSQEQFPNMDLAVTFHMGLCLRVPRSQRGRVSHRAMRSFGGVFTKLQELNDAVGQAQNLGDYQAIGMRGREALLAFAETVQDAAEWTEGTRPKRADFRAWAELICDVVLASPRYKERRHLFKTMLTEAWVFSNWLTHAHFATWHDAEAASSTIEHILGLAASLVLRHIQSVPEACPKCQSPNLSPEEGRRTDLPEVLWERPVCSDCGWTGTPVPVELDDGEELITRSGRDGDDEFVIPTVPLVKFPRPQDETD
jgi:hypothetical protein